MTPAAYLRLRREAAGLTLDDVATRLAPQIVNRHTAYALIRLWEADGVVAEIADVIRLRAVFRFDVTVYRQLVEEPADRHPRICRSCACSQDDACIDGAAGSCAWSSDDFCTRCEAREIRNDPAWMTAAMDRTTRVESAAA